MKKAVFLDRDGTLNKVIYRNGKPSSPWNFGEFEFLDSVKESLQKLKDKNYILVLITNQPDIARENLMLEELNKINTFIKKELDLDEILICPHDNEDNCGCRKPKPGMIFYAATKYDVDISQSFVIGDSHKDMQVAQAANCRGILIDANYNKNVSCFDRVKDIKSAIERILNVDFS